MAKKRVGIIGCGAIFDRHLEAIKTNPNDYELVALCDIDKRKLEIRSKEYQVPGFLDYKKMLKEMNGKMDFVTIATPNSLHFKQTIDSLMAGYNTLTEKPVDFDHTKIKELDFLAKKLGRKAYAVLQVRYNPTIAIIKKALEEKLLGDLRSVSLIQRWQRPSTYFDSWRADINIGGRTLYEVGIHYLDVFQVLFGVPKVIASSTFNNKHKNVVFEDTVFSIISLPNGGSGSLEVTVAAEPCNLECSLAILGSEGYIKAGGRALDQIEKAMFLTAEFDKKWEKIQKSFGESLEPNSYGTHAGSCPNHPMLYSEMAAGRGVPIAETVNCIEFIENVYAKEVKQAKNKRTVQGIAKTS